MASLTGCANKLVVETTVNVPKTLAEEIPADVAIYFPDTTRNHAYVEPSRDGKDWSITTGPSQVALLNQVFESMFASTSSVENIEDVLSEHDLVIIPELQDMQFSLPSKTHLGFYEVWMQYEFSIKLSDGTSIAMFPVNGYGTAPTAFLTSNDEGIQQAANTAFRELGAKLVVRFNDNIEIQKWLSSRKDQNEDS
ncbi:hypothetical protein EYS14_22405 [Alteromonadaceae bacterium M269]|nr:hypothetical protein EYS14_22405 [Alteromonadaceae bacterium M269]